MRESYPIEFFTEIHRVAISTNPAESDLAGIIRSESDLYFLGLKLSSCNDTFERAAIALYSIACHHPFFEGNKRTALLTCELLLEDKFIVAPEEDIFRFVVNVACDKVPIGDIITWLKANSSLTE